MELNSHCQIVRGEGAQTFQVGVLLAARGLDEELLGLDRILIETKLGKNECVGETSHPRLDVPLVLGRKKRLNG